MGAAHGQARPLVVSGRMVISFLAKSVAFCQFIQLIRSFDTICFDSLLP